MFFDLVQFHAVGFGEVGQTVVLADLVLEVEVFLLRGQHGLLGQKGLLFGFAQFVEEVGVGAGHQYALGEAAETGGRGGVGRGGGGGGRGGLLGVGGEHAINI